MKILLCKQGEAAELSEIENGLEAMQKTVGGFIETVTINNDLVMVCNEEGKLNGSLPNRFVGNDVIHGDFFICGFDGEDFADLPSKYEFVLKGIYGEPIFDKEGQPIL